MKNFVDMVLDFETSGKRGWHGVRNKFNPPRITQVGLIKITGKGPEDFKALIGGGQGEGFTNVINEIIEKHNPLSELDLPPGFWKDLAIYDPSVTQKGSLLNDQVRRHVREYLTLKKTGQTGMMKSASEYISDIQGAIQSEINSGNAVRLHAFNKDFDISQMINEMYRAGPKEGKAFMGWMQGHMKSGMLELKGIEEGIHESMFNLMMKDENLAPRHASSKYFEQARRAGLKTVGIEATTPHYALREMINDIRSVQNGASVKQVLQGLPADIQAEFKNIKSYKDFLSFKKFIEDRPGGKDLIMGHLRRRVAKKHGLGVAKHISNFGYEYTSGWRHELLAMLTGGEGGKHSALGDVIDEWGTHLRMQNVSVSEKAALHIMTNEEFISKEAALKYAKFGEESARALKTGTARQLMTVAHKTRIAPPAALSRLARSPNTLPLLAAAGGLLIANQIAKNAYDSPMVESMRQEMKGHIEGLRRSVSQWDAHKGIFASTMEFANQSVFGSGRRSPWEVGSYKGVPFAPDLGYHQQQWAMHPEWQYQEAMDQARVNVNRWGPSREELANRRIDMADYIYELKDADTILLRRAWINQNIPIIGPALGAVQGVIQNAAKTLTGQDFGFSVRLKDVDAPETAKAARQTSYVPGGMPGGEEATGMMANIMGGSAIQRILFGGRATHINISGQDVYGRTVGTPYAGGRDLAGELVQSGGAVSTSLRQDTYLAQENIARSSGRGIWQHPMYEAVPQARKLGIRPSLSPVKRYSTLSRSLDAAAMYSLMAYAQNPQMHGVRDQHSQNLYSRGF